LGSYLVEASFEALNGNLRERGGELVHPKVGRLGRW
jgi:hypothetical protein